MPEPKQSPDGPASAPAATPEPLAAILAEMRKAVVPMICGRPKIEAVSIRDVLQWADRIEAAVQRFVADDCAKCAHYHAATISLKDALALANTIANHGINANDLGDKASATIYALCDEVRTVRGEDANIKQEVQGLRRELRDLRRAPGNAAALREALEEQSRYWWSHIRNYSENEMLKRTDTALAAPARNCDRFDSKTEAETTFVEETGGGDDSAPLYWQMFANWLFATEEGGAE